MGAAAPLQPLPGAVWDPVIELLLQAALLAGATENGPRWRGANGCGGLPTEARDVFRLLPASAGGGDSPPASRLLVLNSPLPNPTGMVMDRVGAELELIARVLPAPSPGGVVCDRSRIPAGPLPYSITVSLRWQPTSNTACLWLNGLQGLAEWDRLALGLSRRCC